LHNGAEQKSDVYHVKIMRVIYGATLCLGLAVELTLIDVKSAEKYFALAFNSLALL